MKTFFGEYRIRTFHLLLNIFLSIVELTISDPLLRKKLLMAFSIGIMAKKQQEQLKIIIGGLLPCDKVIATRSIINKVNKVLRQKICKLQDFYFMEEDFDWTANDDSLNMEFYYQDRIHLNHKGNEKLIPSSENSSTLSHCHHHAHLLASSCGCPQLRLLKMLPGECHLCCQLCRHHLFVILHSLHFDVMCLHLVHYSRKCQNLFMTIINSF